MTKRARTRNFDHANIEDLKDVSCVPQSSNHCPIGSRDKVQKFFQLFTFTQFILLTN